MNEMTFNLHIGAVSFDLHDEAKRDWSHFIITPKKGIVEITAKAYVS